MYVLRRLPFLDTQTGNYLILLQVDNVPSLMKPYTKVVHPPVNSPFQFTRCGCVTIMVDASYNSLSCACDRRTLTSANTQNYLQLCDLGHAIRLWRQEGYTLDKTITEIMREQDTQVIGVFVETS